MLRQMGVTVDPAAILVKNTAAALVTATLPAFAQPGMQIDATVAAMGDAASLQGGLPVDDQPAGHRWPGVLDCAGSGSHWRIRRRRVRHYADAR